MSSKHSKPARKLSKAIARQENLADLAYIASSPRNPGTIKASPRSERGLYKALKKGGKRGT